jgi:hypothetical protein
VGSDTKWKNWIKGFSALKHIPVKAISSLDREHAFVA